MHEALLDSRRHTPDGPFRGIPGSDDRSSVQPTGSRARRPRPGRGTTIRTLVLWLGAAAAFAGATRAQTSESTDTLLDGIVAVVGERPILRSEVEEQFAVLAQQFGVDPADTSRANELRRDIVQRLIDEHILVLEAEAQGVEVSEEEVEEIVDRAIAENVEKLGGQQAFEQELRREGLTLDGLRAQFMQEARQQQLSQRFIQRDIRPKIEMNDQKVRAFYQDNKEDLPNRPRAVLLQDLFFMVRPDSVVARRAYERAQSIRDEVQEGLSFAEAAKRHSDEPNSAEQGGAIGRVQRGQLNPELESIAFALPRGVVSEPVLTPFGYHLIMVDDKDPNGKWVSANLILVEVIPSRSDQARTEDRAKKIREQVVSGKLDFTEAVRRFSDDESSRQQDGKLGWIPMSGLVGDVLAAVDTLEKGEISPPTPGDGGFHVLKVLDEQTERSYEFDEIAEDLRNLAYQAEMDRLLEELLTDLRKKYFIETRASF